MRTTPDDDVAMRHLQAYFDAAGEIAAQGRIRFAIRHPLRTVGAIHDAKAVPRLERAPATGPDADLIEHALERRSSPFTHAFWSLTAVLPVDPDSRVLAKPGRAMARAIRLAHRAHLQWREVQPGPEQRSLLERARASERERDPQHAPDPAANEALLGRGLWFVAETHDGRPLLQAVVLLDGDWALLANFRTVESSVDAGNARFWMTSVVADELSLRGARYLIEATHPVRLSNGIRYFQRITGFRMTRIVTVAARQPISPLADLPTP